MLVKIYNFGKDKMLVSTLSTELSLNMATICNIVCHFTTVKMWMLNFKYSCGQKQLPAQTIDR
jgi:hypothetical protein